MKKLAIPWAALLVFMGCATGKVWENWSPEEQKRYFGLSFIEEDSVLAKYRSIPERELRDQWYKMYWSAKGQDSTELYEHQQRLDIAWSQFGGKMFFKDDRSRVMVNFGRPEVEMKNQPYMHSLESEMLSGGKYVKERSWTVWEYPGQGRYYDFLRNDRYFNYELVAATYSGNIHGLAFFAVDSVSGRKEVLHSGTPIELPLVHGFSRFRAADTRRVRFEVYWELPVSAERREGDERGYTVYFDLKQNKSPVSRDTIRYRVRYTGENILSARAVGQKNYDLQPGRYDLDVRLVPDGSDTVYSAVFQAELVAYRPGEREVSDLEMASLQDNTFISEEYTKGPYRRVIPSISRLIGRFQPFYVYYEVYNLGLDAGQQHRVLVGHGIFQCDTTGIVKEGIIDTKDLLYEGKGDQLSACHKIHPMGMEPGQYILVIEIKDVISGRSSKVTHNFEIGGGSTRPPKIIRDEPNKSYPIPRPAKTPLRF